MFLSGNFCSDSQTEEAHVPRETETSAEVDFQSPNRRDRNASILCISPQVRGLSHIHPALPQATRQGPPGVIPGTAPPVISEHLWPAIRMALFRVLPASIRTVVPTAEPAGTPQTTRRIILGLFPGTQQKIIDARGSQQQSSYSGKLWAILADSARRFDIPARES